ncbi:PREDICTED: cysteine-rich receptor-like protein kinase 10 [Lupinus angustifolius]|uniref:cysteine-rich receptor-like protein kinase 10 n=1 Tax=Lupinus angustifolius TaxID=3871 RepID=UPI00092FB577|nr:PREDICTED: cysteine-rich receptor-like protein kinase 10 [Lupinus angustifolius]
MILIITKMLLFYINHVVTPFLLLSLLFVSFTSSTPTYNGIYCPNNITYETNNNTVFQTNLKVLLSSLLSNATQGSSSYTTAMGMGNSNAVNGVYLCRGDVSTATCTECMVTAVANITTLCPNKTESIIWYDECMLRYTNTYFNPLSIDPRLNLWENESISTSDLDKFNETLLSFLGSLGSDAANSETAMKYSTKEWDFTEEIRVFGLAECAPGVTSEQCEGCLVNASKTLVTCCEGKEGARALLAWCNIRYDLFQFYNTSGTSISPPFLSPPPPSGKKKYDTKTIVIIVVLVVFSIILICLGCCFLLRRRLRKKYKTLLKENFGDEGAALESLQFNLATIEVATKKFSNENKIGKGGFGEVYKGILSNGREIAVKKLSQSSGQGAIEFKNEVLLIAKLQHRNLVTLLGFCLDEQEKMLIYEYVPNESLDYFLFGSHESRLLNWLERYNIIKGIAQGIHYLHDHSRLKIIHRDLKASNVLLDSNMNPKISDFGMARIIALDEDRGSTCRIVGTYGYMSPEYAMHGQFSEKSDVFSFGVILLEIISAKRNARSIFSDDLDDLLSYAWKQWRDETPLKILDQDIKECCNDSEVIKCIQIGLLCVQDRPDDRPTMAKIVSYFSSTHSEVELPFPGEPINSMHNQILQKIVVDDSSSGSKQLNELSMPR